MHGPIIALLAGAAMLGQQAPAGRPALIGVSARVSAERVATGQRFQVALDLVPAAGIHVYAPDVRNYRPLVVSIQPQSGLAAIGAPRYPASESYYYAPLKETVPVYQKRFRVVQEVSLDRSITPGSTVIIAGVLSYQACDDRVCYPPRSVPVSWTVRVMEGL